MLIWALILMHHLLLIIKSRYNRLFLFKILKMPSVDFGNYKADEILRFVTESEYHKGSKKIICVGHQNISVSCVALLIKSGLSLLYLYEI